MGLPVRRFGTTGWGLTTIGLDAVGLKLTDADLDTIAAAIASSGAGKGPSRPATVAAS
jgi:hypothetical protein